MRVAPRPVRFVAKPDGKPLPTFYLDQWVWIELSRVHYGKSESWRAGYEAVMSSVKQGTARFPLSFSHLKELGSAPDDASRGRLVDFMVGVWNANAIRPWPHMLDPEAENAVRIMMGQAPIDLTNFVFGKGIVHLVGAEPTLFPKHADARPIPPETLKELGEMIMSPDLLSTFVKDPEQAKRLRTATESEKAYASRVRAGIHASPSHPDKKKRHDIDKARFMANVVGKALVGAMMKATPDPKALMDTHLSSRDKIEAILKSMPTFHTFYILDHARTSTRSVKPNDIWDLALNIAIPYCDVVVTERAWCNVARRAGLDKINKTQMIRCSADLAAALQS